MNLSNYGITSGRLTRDPLIRQNRDGSTRVLFTIAAPDNFRSRDGSRGTQYIPVEAYVAHGRPMGIYDCLHQGDAVTIAYSARTNNYTTAEGSRVYGVALRVESIQFAESRSAADARRANRTAAAPATATRRTSRRSTAA